jgi:hypothetical protein
VVKDNDTGWTLPQHKPITKEVLDRAIRNEEDAVAQEHQAQKAWFHRSQGAVMVKLTDGRVFGAETKFIPSLQGASPRQLVSLHTSDDGIYLVSRNSICISTWTDW